MHIEVIHGDATAIEGDVLALKYAQARYGLDAYVAQQLHEEGHSEDIMSPRVGGFRILPSVSSVAATNILFVGVESLRSFGYQQIRVFARKVLSALAGQLPNTRRLIVTVHGPGYGLDENEAFESQLAGFLDALETSDTPKQLEVISFVETDRGRARRLKKTLEKILPPKLLGRKERLDTTSQETKERLRSVGYASGSKAHVLVAMPFSKAYEDTYNYGIVNAVKSAGLLCERADKSTYTGDAITWLRDRIRTASFVIADLSEASPNVYLEVGFAWGCKVPTVLLAKEKSNLLFDVQCQRCLLYENITGLEKILEAELRQLNLKSGI